ncbi:rRNA biogenesis protein-like protein RRP5 [Sporormia fimetaria CBS 119925]|uniref:rRNA biogenesis protein RRP5 n=1 Tax=Sporormia fimetaria CBS 119925 TaxID=1340428 RepID=A0A6A6V8B7_9PLEO|nr:rRNA biogenesis protein-like protein RRP5 [Sporormia fimetaria CBS 119925]
MAHASRLQRKLRTAPSTLPSQHLAMVAPKRKAESNGVSALKDVDQTAGRSAKRQRKSDAAPDAVNTAKSPASKPQKAPAKSVFKDEEKAFPRGGASVLTPLEHKQIQIKANQDVLFEQAGGKKRSGEDDMSDAASDAGSEAAKKSKKRKSKKSKKTGAEEKENVIRVESLSYKRLVQGSLVLGQVSEITARDLVLALPNNLSGFVPLTAISPQFTAKLEKLLEEDEQEDKDDDDASDDMDDVDLESMFHVGQYLRACVTSTGDDPTSGSTKKRIELSIEPSLANRGMEKSSIVVNGTVQASVISNEDHGLIMDMGLDEPQLKGFLPKSEIGKGIEHAKIKEGTVFLCAVQKLNSDGRIITLSADHQKAGNVKKLPHIPEAPTIDAFLPGTAVDMLVTDTTTTTVTGKVMGMLDATADQFHSGAVAGLDMTEKHKIGARAKARIICTFPGSEPKKVGVSLLDHVLSLSHRTTSAAKSKEKKDPLAVLPVSSFVEEAKVTRVDPTVGLYLDLGVRGVPGFAHISRLSDDKIERLYPDSGLFKVGSTHRARIVGYGVMDGLFQVSLEKKILEQPFLRIQDVKVGQVVKGKVEKLIVDKKGAPAVLVKLSEGIVGLVSENHLADVRLQHPERKFREGASVTARVLSIDVEKRHIRLTLKKSLVNSDVKPWLDYAAISVGDKGPGTLVEVKSNGAKVRFYGNVGGWLPVAEMSEAFIGDATKHFQAGQVVNVRVVSIDSEARHMIVSCKDPSAIDGDKETRFQSINLGDIVSGTIIEKSAEMATVDLGFGVRGILRVGHLTDGSDKKDQATMGRLRVGGPLEDVVVIEKRHNLRNVILSNKPSLRKLAQAKKLITKFEDVEAGENAQGFVRRILPDKIFVEFGGGVVGLLFKSQLPDDQINLPDFGLRPDQSITARVSHVDAANGRFWLSLRSDAKTSKKVTTEATGEATVNAVDKNVKSTTDLAFGATTTVRVKSIKDTQLNVQVADNVPGRVSVAEIFNSWDEIKDKKHPLSQFKMKDTLTVKVLGLHDARNHRFLPITHRQGKVPTFELTAKKVNLKSQSDLLSLADITPGSTHIAFINNIADRHVWVNITANIRGRIALLDLSDDLSLLGNVEENFPIGSALKVRVKTVDVSTNRLELTATSADSAKALELKDLKEGLVLPARVTKIHDSSIVVQINENIAAPIYLEHLADDYDKANPKSFTLGDAVRVCVTDIDLEKKRLGLSARPSRVLSSSLPVKDPEITDIAQLKLHQVVRGFVKVIVDKGIFVRLGPHVDAFVKVAHLSDEYIKDWKKAFAVDQLVTGKIIAADAAKKSAQMTLKKSMVDGEYKELLQFSDMKVGQIVTAKVRHVQDYGVFIVVDNSRNVSGLCHVSQIADSRVENVKALYKEGDAVKAKVLEIDPEKRRISFTLKYSAISGEAADDEDDEMGSEEDVDEDEDEADASDISEMEVDYEDEEDEEEDDMRSVKSAESDEEMADADEDDDEEEGGVPLTESGGLKGVGFDWTGATLDVDDRKAADDSDSDEEKTKKKKKHKKAAIQEDRTGDLDAHGPQSVADYERLLLGQPNSAELWVRYMVFQRELNEIEKARQIARRALKMINPREDQARLDVWTALLHLENDFGSNDQIEETFKEGCLQNDSREMHERMIKIYISSGKLEKADNLYQSMTKNKSFTPTPSLWLSYASFLMSTLQPPSPSRARALLSRATQSVPESEHRYLTTKFAALEFKSPNGDPERGRTIFEGLVSTWPKKGDIWDVYVELEKSHGSEENVRALYERMCKGNMKARRAHVVFRHWREWEESVGNAKGVQRVRALEREWAEKKAEKKDEE